MAQAVSSRPPFEETPTTPAPHGRIGVANRGQEVFTNTPLVGLVAACLRERNPTQVSKPFRATFGDRMGVVMAQECALFPFSGGVRDQNAEQVLRGQPIQKRVPVKKPADDNRLFRDENSEAPSHEIIPGVVDPASVADLFDYAVQSSNELDSFFSSIGYETTTDSSERLHDLWSRITNAPLFQKNALERFDKKKLDRSELLQICLLFHDLRQLKDNKWIKEGNQKEWIAGLRGILNSFYQRYSLAQRFNAVFKEQRDPKEMAGLYKALQQNQRDAAALTQDTLERFRALSRISNGTYAHAHFVELEACAMEGVRERFTNLSRLVEGIRYSLDWDHRAAIPAFTTSKEILDFMHAEQNQELLQSIDTVRMWDVDFSDPEVLRILSLLRGLQTLQITARSEKYALKECPQELATFPQLKVLLLEGHAFTKIPDIATRIPNLLVFDLLHNREQIDELPEAFTRHYLSGWASLAFEPVRELAPLVNCFCCLMGGRNPHAEAENDFVDAVSNYHTACLPYEQFKRIPFHLWFREHFSIPYIPTLLVGLYEGILGVLIGTTTDFLRRCTNAGPDTRDCIYGISFLLFGILSLPITVTAILLDIPIFIANVIINRVIEPIVSWVRESLCGCDPMVEL